MNQMFCVVICSMGALVLLKLLKNQMLETSAIFFFPLTGKTHFIHKWHQQIRRGEPDKAAL